MSDEERFTTMVGLLREVFEQNKILSSQNKELADKAYALLGQSHYTMSTLIESQKSLAERLMKQNENIIQGTFEQDMDMDMDMDMMDNEESASDDETNKDLKHQIILIDPNKVRENNSDSDSESYSNSGYDSACSDDSWSNKKQKQGKRDRKKNKKCSKKDGVKITSIIPRNPIQYNDDEKMSSIARKVEIIAQLRKMKELSSKNDSGDDNDNKVELSDDDSENSFDVFMKEPLQIDSSKAPGYENIGKVENIDDLINIGKKFKTVFDSLREKEKSTRVRFIKKYGLYSLGRKKYVIDPERTVDLIKPLKKLKKMVGLKSVKEQTCEFIIHKLQSPPSPTMSNTLITGPPGVGKTTFSKIFATIQSALRVVRSKRIICTTRDDWIGEHYGETEKKTKALLKKGNGGVIIIDESYSLGSNEGKDSFAKACLVIILEYMSTHPNDVCFHFLGYKEDVEKSLLKSNKGMNRRFPIRFDVPKYDCNDMTDILIYFLKKNRIKLEHGVEKSHIHNIISKNIEKFEGNAGDIENIIEKCMMINNKIKENANPKTKNVFTLKTIEDGIARHHSESKKNKYPVGMYT